VLRALPGGAKPWPVVATALVLGALALLVLPVLAGVRAELVTVAAAAVLGAAIFRKRVFRWRSLIALLLLIILFIPIRRYILPGHLPFQLEPYRIGVALLVAAWFASMLIDPRVRFRRTGLEGPLLLYLVAVFGSILLNGARITPGAVDSNVIKSVTFELSFVLLAYLIVSVIRREQDVVFLLKFLVIGSAIIAILAVIESRTKFNLFDHLSGYIPFLKWNYGVSPPARLGKFRAYGPAEHPIALSAMLAMMVPLAGYFALTQRRKRWWVVMAMLVTGCLATVSRTGVLMLVAEALMFAVLRPRQMRRAWIAVIPLLVAVHIALPGTLGALKDSFFPPGGLVQQQQGFDESGRFGAARLDPTFAQIHGAPLFGIGYGTRITGEGTASNAQTLDDQWLDTALDTGFVGVAAWIWLLVRLIRRTANEARRDLSERGWLLTSLAASVVGFAVSMLTYDTFSFVQVTLIFYILIALTSSLLVTQRQAAYAPVDRRGYELSAGAVGVALLYLALAMVLFVFFQGPSVKFLVLVLVLVTLGTRWLERSLDRKWKLPLAGGP
jgi:polysaccharide biosynthesis protein PslJ